MGPHHDRGIRAAGATPMSECEPHLVHAETLIEHYEQRRPDIVALATAVSLATRVEPGLLRRARLKLTPGVTVAAEADLWFSPLVASYTLRGLVLDTDVATVLRARLAGDPGRLAAVRELVCTLHELAAPTVKLEEEVLYAALIGDNEEVGRLLERALLTIAREPERASGIARWAARAIAALPPEARETPAARELSAAAKGLGRAPVEVGVQLLKRGVQVRQPPAADNHVLALPPEPLQLEVRPEGASDRGVTLRVKRGRVVRRDFGRAAAALTGVELRTADGRVARLRPRTAKRDASRRGLVRLVVCCDGAWNRPDQVKGGVASPTNVLKVARGVAKEDPTGVTQLVYYHPGVGTERLERIRGGAFGLGLSRDARECYRFLVENYQPGDELYFFGFSRGAFTARSLAGLIGNAGILRAEHVDRIGEAYRLYRHRRDDGSELQRFRAMYSHEEREIRFIGVWDTVGALGIPGMRGPLVKRLWGFHDTTLSRRVRFAYQALAIDEERGLFQPTLWEQQSDATGQTLQQVWFAGVHSDVGGGYPDASLAEVALVWMTERARESGLVFQSTFLNRGSRTAADELSEWAAAIAPDPLGPLHDSRTGFYRLLPSQRRTIVDPHGSAASAVASSAIQRRDKTSGYAPRNLDEYLAGPAPKVVDWSMQNRDDAAIAPSSPPE
jgi:hypothetical protein